MKKRNFIVFACAAIMILTASVKSASAYFTTYVSAVGMKEVVLGENTEIEERIDGVIKNITIKADTDSEPVWVRVKGFSPDEAAFPVRYNLGENPDSNWTEGADGWWDYAYPIANNGDVTYDTMTSTLTVGMELPTTKPDGTPVKPGDTFNLVVVYECTPVLYDEDTLEPLAPDWNKGVTVHETAQGEVTPDDPGTGSGTTGGEGTETGTEGGEGTESGGNNG